ncbi:copper resistance protein CopQ [Burkholderiaceae bacterium 16]|nr:copper resistance protein CopQ [Burkholderiaceae bacterium 16]
MNTKRIAKSLLTAAALAAAFVAGGAQASGPKDSAFSGDRYGYNFRVYDSRSAFTDGARAGKFDPFTEGARVGKADPYSDGARIVAGLDRTGVSSSPARSRDVYSDGARTGKFDPFTEGARVGKADPYTDGALA